MRLLPLIATLALALPAQAQPRPNAAPETTLSIASSAVSATVQADGEDRVATPGSGCNGYITFGQPDATVTVTGDGPLSIYAVSGSDTTLLVHDPNGRWHCSDDAHGSNPAVTFQTAAPGRYVVWVGTFGSAASATLRAVRGQPAW